MRIFSDPSTNSLRIFFSLLFGIWILNALRFLGIIKTKESLNPDIEKDKESTDQNLAEPWQPSRIMGKEEWEGLQKERKDILRKSCQSILPSGENNLKELLRKASKYPNQTIVDERHKFIYCSIEKVASKRIRTMMFEKNSAFINAPIRLSSLQEDIYYILPNLLDGTKYKEPEVKKKLETFTKFIIVRHPILRIVSAYVDKLTTNKDHLLALKNKIGKQINPNFQPEDKISFPQFVDYVIEAHRTKDPNLDRHFAPYSSLCHPCLIDFDIIGKHETYSSDIFHLTQKIYKSVDSDRYRYKPQHKTARSYVVLLQQLNQTQRNDLYKVYELDYKLFNYDKK